MVSEALLSRQLTHRIPGLHSPTLQRRLAERTAKTQKILAMADALGTDTTALTPPALVVAPTSPAAPPPSAPVEVAPQRDAFGHIHQHKPHDSAEPSSPAPPPAAASTVQQCFDMSEKHGVVPGQTFGTLPAVRATPYSALR